MDGIFAREMEQDRTEEQRFVAAGFCERVYMCWREVFDAKKYCFLSLLVVILLLLQIVQLVTPPAFLDEMMASPRFGRYLHRFLYDNVTAAVAAAAEAATSPSAAAKAAKAAKAAAATRRSKCRR